MEPARKTAEEKMQEEEDEKTEEAATMPVMKEDMGLMGV